MIKIISKIICQIAVLFVFCLMAGASASSQSATDSSGFDWRGAAVGGAAAYNGYIIIGTASSEAEARDVAKNKGYSYYLWDSVNGNVYGK